MTSTASRDPSQQEIVKGALLAGVINAVINGAIQAWLLRGSETIQLSVDGISAVTHTVLGAAVPLAVSLAMILTAVRDLARSEGRQLQSLIDEALGDLVEKHKNARPRAGVMAPYQASHASFAPLYKKLAE